jgi:hypothetical protein
MPGYSRLAARRVQRARMRYMRLAALLYVIIGLAALIFYAFGVGWFSRLSIPEAMPDEPVDAEIGLAFGLDRSLRTRTATVEVGTTDPEIGESDTLVSARLGQDLQQTNGPSQFPADQFTVGIARLSANQSIITLTANPWAPERVDPGIYEGTLEIRGPGVEENVVVRAWLRNRDGRWALLAGTILFIGALLGLLIKWITERLTPQASLMRRLSTLKRALSFGDDGSALPLVVRTQVEELADLIERSDYGRAEQLFDELEKQRHYLARISRRFDSLLDQLDSQVYLIGQHGKSRHDVLLLQGVIDSEYLRLLELQSEDVSEHFDETTREAHVLSGVFRLVTTLMTRYLSAPDPTLRDLLTRAQRGEFDAVAHDYAIYEAAAPLRWDEEPSPQGDSEPEPSKVDSRDVEVRDIRREESGGPRFMYRYARGIAGVASVGVVTLVGLKTQYLDSQGFDGSLSGWVTLGLWAVAVELSGVSVLEVLGRLGSSSAATKL